MPQVCFSGGCPLGGAETRQGAPAKQKTKCRRAPDEPKAVPEKSGRSNRGSCRRNASLVGEKEDARFLRTQAAVPGLSLLVECNPERQAIVHLDTVPDTLA